MTPDDLSTKSLAEIRELPLWEGNKQKRLRDLFDVEETDTGHSMIVIDGDVSRVRRIGSKMTQGEIVIKGDVGMHLGEEMRGGKITVHGDASSWAGCSMISGDIEIFGNGGDYLAAPYRGSLKGMKGGRIVVHGNVGVEAGGHMRKGLIKILGNSGQFPGFHMCDGTISIAKNCEGRAGACMTGGKLVIQGFLRSVLPTFTMEGVKSKIKIEGDDIVEGSFYVFAGDLTENGKGKLYVSRKENPQLRTYERFLQE